MKKEKGFDFGRMVFGCVFVAFVTVFAWIMSDVFFAPSLKGYETVPCRIVKSSVKMENVNRFIFTVEFAYEHHGRTYKSNSLRRPGQGEFEFSRLASRLLLLERYAPGTEHECRVNPENPFDAVLAVENPVEDPDALAGDIGAMAFMGLFGVVGFALMVGGLWMMLSLLRGSNGTPLSFERRILKRLHTNWMIPGLFTFVWNVFSWSFVLGFVGEEQVRRLDPVLLVLAIFPLVGIFLIGCFIFEIVRELRAPRLVLTLSCAMWKQGSPAQADWSLDSPEEIESLEIALERTRMKGSGKHRRQITVASQSCCRHLQSMVTGAGSFGFTVPGSANDGCNLSFGAKVKMKSIRRAFTFTYPLPSPFV